MEGETAGLGYWFGKRFDATIVEAVNPGVNGYLLTTFPCIFKDGGAGNVECLCGDIKFAESIHCGIYRHG